MDAAGSAEEEARNGVSEADVEKIKQYSFYSGIKNYKNLWLFLQFITNKGGEMPAEPSAYCWTGIYHPGLPELCTTDLRSYKKNVLQRGLPNGWDDFLQGRVDMGGFTVSEYVYS